MSPAFAASPAVAARALGPSSATSADRVLGPRELLITTLWSLATASRAIWLPMCPAPIIPMVIMVVNPTSEFLARRYDHRRSSLAHLHSSYGVLRAGGSSNRPGKSAAPLAPVAAR